MAKDKIKKPQLLRQQSTLKSDDIEKADRFCFVEELLPFEKHASNAFQLSCSYVLHFV